MVYVVERYLPGLSRSDLLRGLSRLERAHELRGEASGVRYLGSTLVLEDEACFCQFDGPTEAAVAEANRRAGLPFDRIVSAVTVQPERRTTMNVSTTVPPTIQIRRSRLIGLIGAAAALAAAVTWALVTFVANPGGDSVQASARTPASYELALNYANGLAALGQMQRVQDEVPVSYGRGLAAIGKMQQGSIGPADRASSYTPAQLRAIRDYKAYGASQPLTQAEVRSIGHYLFGTSGR